MNKYEVISVVGEGAYGVVLKCRNKVRLRRSGFVSAVAARCLRPLNAWFSVARSRRVLQDSGEFVAIKKFKESERK